MKKQTSIILFAVFVFFIIGGITSTVFAGAGEPQGQGNEFPVKYVGPSVVADLWISCVLDTGCQVLDVSGDIKCKKEEVNIPTLAPTYIQWPWEYKSPPLANLVADDFIGFTIWNPELDPFFDIPYDMVVQAITKFENDSGIIHLRGILLWEVPK